MKKLVIIRHADYGHDGRINQSGKRQMSRLAEQLRENAIDGGSMLILSSSAGRASDSAHALADAMGGIPVEPHAILWSDNMHREDVPGALALLREAAGRADNLFVVTHLEYAEDLPERFSRDEQWPAPIRSRELSRGRAILLDCEGKTATYL